MLCINVVLIVGALYVYETQCICLTVMPVTQMLVTMRTLRGKIGNVALRRPTWKMFIINQRSFYVICKQDEFCTIQ